MTDASNRSRADYVRGRRTESDLASHLRRSEQHVARITHHHSNDEQTHSNQLDCIVQPQGINSCDDFEN